MDARWGAVAAAAAVVVGSACTPDPKTTVDRLAAAMCDRWVRCGQWERATAQECRTFVLDAYALERAGLTRGTVAPTPGAEACIRSLVTLGCQRDLSEECTLALTRGLLASGQGCDASLECEDGGVCFGGSWCGRTCQAPGGAGMSCLDLDGRCQPGLACRETDLTCQPRLAPGADCSSFFSGCPEGSACPFQTCEPLAPVDASCQSIPLDEPCVDQAYCGEGGVCRARRGPGQPCIHFLMCQPGLACLDGQCTPGGVGTRCDSQDGCAGGLRCDAVLRTCQEATVRELGEACTDDALLCRWLPCSDVRPAPDGGVGTPGVCRFPRVGDACDPGAGCGAELRCLEGRCVPWHLGDRCTVRPACGPEGTCDPGSSTCVARSTQGGPCQDDSTCAPELRCARGVPDAGPGGRCLPRGGAGAPCATQGGVSTCAWFFECVDGACVHRGAPGEPCLNGTRCVTGACRALDDGGTACGAPLDAGAGCYFHAECASGTCDRSTRTCAPTCP